MAWARVFQVLVDRSNTLPAPFLSRGRAVAWVSIGDPQRWVVWLCNHAVLRWCPSLALAFVPRQGWLMCCSPCLFEWGFIIIDHAR
jgi:hypothetical protein